MSLHFFSGSVSHVDVGNTDGVPLETNGTHNFCQKNGNRVHIQIYYTAWYALAPSLVSKLPSHPYMGGELGNEAN